jgi:hypothetical protein
MGVSEARESKLRELVSQSQLELQAHNSLSLRVKAYNQMGYFDPPLTLYHLRKAYRLHGVKLKRFKIRRAWRRPDDNKGKLKDLRYFDLLKAQIVEINDLNTELV